MHQITSHVWNGMGSDLICFQNGCLVLTRTLPDNDFPAKMVQFPGF